MPYCPAYIQTERERARERERERETYQYIDREEVNANVNFCGCRRSGERIISFRQHSLCTNFFFFCRCVGTKYYNRRHVSIFSYSCNLRPDFSTGLTEKNLTSLRLKENLRENLSMVISTIIGRLIGNK